MRIALVSLGAVAACGGEEFGNGGLSTDRDGSLDAKPPSEDQNGSGGGGANTGGWGGTSGAGGNGGAAGGGALDSGRDDGRADGTGMSKDAPRDERPFDSPDETADDALIDGHPGTDGDAAVDAADAPPSVDGPATTDVKDVTDAPRDTRNDLSTTPDTGVADATCSEPVTYYRDEDGDGYGTNGSTSITCSFPGNKWSVLGGDCRDDLPSVKPFTAGSPSPPAYSGTGYADTTKPQGLSFDYDCTGSEDADPDNPHGVDPDCSKLLNCTGVGYVPVNPMRMGTGINPRCGSTTLKRCTGALPCNSSLETTTVPYRCR